MYLIPLYEQLHQELLTRDVLHADETTLQVLHEPGKKPQTDSYMWLYRTSGDTDKPIVLYEYQAGRGARSSGPTRPIISRMAGLSSPTTGQNGVLSLSSLTGRISSLPIRLREPRGVP